MFNIGNYFKKFTNLEDDSNATKKVVDLALKEVCGVEGVLFEVKKGVLYLKTSPMIKSIVFMKKAALLEYFSIHMSKLSILDIR